MNLKNSDGIYCSARNLYSDKLHYHNFSHINDVLDYAEVILKQCNTQNISYDKKIITHAILFHDAGYIEDHKNKGFKDKESYSAFLAETILLDADESEKHIAAVSQAILATRMDALCQSNNDMVVRAADLYGLIAPYNQFKNKTIALYKEREFMSGKKITWEEYKGEACDIIKQFIASPIQLDIELFQHNNDKFHSKVSENIDKLIEDKID